MDFINDLKQGHRRADEQEERSSQPPPPEQQNRGFLDRLGDAVGDLSGKPRHEAPPPPPPPPKNIFEKIGDALKGEDGAPPPPPPQPEGLFDKISDTLLGREKQEPKKPETFADKVNNVFGGGASGEAEESHLDKAIDFYQEHVLGSGKQDNESAIEQAKDKQIAGMLRHGFESVTGKDFSSSRGQDKE